MSQNSPNKADKGEAMTMEKPMTFEERTHRDLCYIYQKLEEIRNPSFGYIFKIVLQVLLAGLLLQVLFFLGVVLLLAVLGTSLAGLLQSLHILGPSVQPYNYIIPLFQAFV
jgi:ABC-type bacteriocin/lantibiotic exporter with double-glycine peptidase domain